MDSISLIVAALAPLPGRQVLDIGCGAGALARSLAAGGAVVTGLDTNPDAVAAAQRAVPVAHFVEGNAEALAFPDGVFEAVVFLNSLHHVADPAAALREARRVARPGSPVVVVEPVADGSAFAVLRIVDDETAVRAAAQRAVAAAIESGTFVCREDVAYERVQPVTTLDAFLAGVVAVDPARAGPVAAHRDALAAAFEAACERDADGRRFLRQPLRAYILVSAPT